MNTDDIVREETRRMLRGMAPLALLTFAVLALFGRYDWGTALSIIIGTAYTLFNFTNMARTAARAVALGEPARAQRMLTSRYVLHYGLTAVLLIAAFKIEPLNPFAVAVPLFYPKLILIIASGVSRKKGG